MDLSIAEGGSLAIKATQVADPGATKQPHPNRTECTITLDGGTIEARWSRTPQTHHLGNGRCDVEFALNRWSWSSGRPAAVWIGELAGARIWRGNLDLRTPQRYYDGDYFEGGGLRLALVPEKSDDNLTWVIIEAIEGALVAERVRDAIRALSFVTGRHHSISVLAGLDCGLEPVEMHAIQGPYSVPSEGNAGRPPVREAVEVDRQWHREFFRALLTKMHLDGDAELTYLARQPYLDAEIDHIEGSFLKLHVALEAFCSKACTLPVSPPRAEEQAWNDWVDTQAEAVRNLAKTPDDGATLIGILRGLWRGSTSNTVERFFAAHDVPLPSKIREQLRGGRNLIAHQFKVTKEASEDFERELDRIALARCVLVAALALHVGYHGPIGDGRASESIPAWWPHKGGVAPRPHRIRCTLA